MSYFTPDNLETAHEIISRYPRKKSALIPLLHLAQEQEGWVTDDAMRQIAELTDTTPDEVKGTGSFYEMFKFHPVGTYMINVCTNLACQLLGGEELLAFCVLRRRDHPNKRELRVDRSHEYISALTLGSRKTPRSDRHWVQARG